MRKQTRKMQQAGITLIALVVTIIVLLILAGVTLNLLLGQNGLINRSRYAYKTNDEAKVSEEIYIAWGAVQVDALAYNLDNQAKSNRLQTELRKADQTATTSLVDPIITVNYKGYQTTINANDGSMTALVKIGTNTSNDSDGINWEELKRTATKHPDQKSTNDIGIDANGNICNLDLWDYEVFDNKLWLGMMLGCYGIDSSCYVPYSQSSIIDVSNVEMINLVCPQCIKIDGEWRDVTGLGSDAFFDYTDVESIKLPSSLTVIKSEVFRNCSSLESITIPSGATIEGDEVFVGCDSLSHITADFGSLPQNYSYDRWPPTLETFTGTGGTEIIESEFSNCPNLTSVTIPNTVNSIGEWAFYDCSKLTSITIPDTVNSIGNSAFYDCNGLTDIVIPNSVTTIGDSVFYGCSKLTSITIPDTVNSIGGSAFYDCNGLTDIVIPNSVTTIGDGAFYNCYELTSITGPVGVNQSSWPSSITSFTINGGTSISSYEFEECSNLTSITIPNTVNSIGNGAFYDCYGLTDIVIPSSVTTIGDSAFYNCYRLTSITGPVGVNQSSWPSSITSFTINGGTSISSYEFRGCSNLTSITIPNTVNSIGNWAFDNCNELTDIVIDSTTIVNDIYSGNLSLSVFGTEVTKLYIKASLYNSTKDTIPSGWTSNYVYKFNSIEDGYAIYVVASAYEGSDGSY